MKRLLLSILLLVFYPVGAWTQQDSLIADKLSIVFDSPQSGELPDGETQNDYVAQVLNLVNVASEIRAGRANQLAESIESSLPDYLTSMAGFTTTPAKTAAFYAASRLLQTSKKPVPAGLQKLLNQAKAGAKQVLSEKCYELLLVCKEKGCIPIPTSLRPVDVNKVDPMGWHYLVDSHCGFKNWKRWKFWQFGQGCGPPLGITACTGSEDSSATPPAETSDTTANYQQPQEMPDQDTQNDYAMQVLNLIHIASEIRAGRSNQLLESIESSLPTYLSEMTSFTKTPLKTATFYTAGLLFRASKKPVAADVQALMDGARGEAKQVLSEQCYELLLVCKEKGCVPLPISLRPVDVNKVDPMGWHYLVDSHCGFKNWKRWKFWQFGQGGGPPLGVTACTGSEESSTQRVPESQRLPEGAIFASATVDPETTIEVQQPGYALIATAEVVNVKRVNPGDRLDARTTSSIHFDDGTGLLINTLKKTALPVAATAGLVSLLTRDQRHPLPVQNGSTTLYIGSDQPFANAAIAVDNQNRIPSVTQAVFLNRNGDMVGQLSTFKNLPLKANSKIAIRELNASGATLREANVEGGVLDGTPAVTFNKINYAPGEKGELLIGNQDNYQKLLNMTSFGGATTLQSEPVRIIPLSDLRGLPSQVPYGTTRISFEAVHPGQARVAVIMPRAVPPKPVSNPGNDEGLKQANATFERWQSQFAK